MSLHWYLLNLKMNKVGYHLGYPSLRVVSMLCIKGWFTSQSLGLEPKEMEILFVNSLGSRYLTSKVFKEEKEDGKSSILNLKVSYSMLYLNF